MNDLDDAPVSEPPVAKNEDHSEDETVMEGLDPVTEASRENVRDQLRRPLTFKLTPEDRAFARALS